MFRLRISNIKSKNQWLQDQRLEQGCKRVQLKMHEKKLRESNGIQVECRENATDPNTCSH